MPGDGADNLVRPVDDEILQSAAKHVLYEVGQVVFMAMRRTALGDDQTATNAVLEAFLVHARILDDFLGKATPHKEDVLAVDYLPTWRPDYALDEAVRLEIDRRVAHITARRVTVHAWARGPYARPAIADAVLGGFGRFVDELSSVFASTWRRRASSPGVSISGRSSTPFYRPGLGSHDLRRERQNCAYGAAGAFADVGDHAATDRARGAGVRAEARRVARRLTVNVRG
jgi:hypothetical protein